MNAGVLFRPHPSQSLKSKKIKEEVLMALTKPKAFLLVSDEQVYFTLENELENCGYEVEGLLSEISQCELILLDHEALQLEMANYLNEIGIEKPVLLVLTETQVYSGMIQSDRLFQDVLVIRNSESFKSGIVISAQEGERSLRTLFMKYLPAVYAPSARPQVLSA